MRLLAVSIGWVTGVALALQWEVPFVSAMLLLGSSGLLILVFWIRKWSLLIPVALAGAVCRHAACGCIAIDTAGTGPLGWDRTAWQWRGVIGETPEARGTASRFLFHLERVNDGSGWQEVSGRRTGHRFAFIRADPGSERHPYSAMGTVFCWMESWRKRPFFADFNYREYLARRADKRPDVPAGGDLVGGGPGLKAAGPSA